MKDYKRLTERDDSLCVDCADIGSCRKTCIRQARYERLQFLENEIEIICGDSLKIQEQLIKRRQVK